MLGEFPRYTRHVLGGPREDVPVLTEELDERAFLFGVQARPHGDELGFVAVVEVDLLRISCRLEVQFACRLDRLRYLQLLLAGLAADCLWNSGVLIHEGCYPSGHYASRISVHDADL